MISSSREGMEDEGMAESQEMAVKAAHLRTA